MAGREVFGKEEVQEVLEVLERKVLFRYGFDKERSGVFKTLEFEKEFARYVGAKHALGVASGTASLTVALNALNLRRGGEVVAPCFTFVATIESIEDAGLKPVLCEMDASMTMDPADLERRITKNTVAIVPVHMMGAACDMDGILAVAGKRKIPVVEDNCQGTGASYRGRKLGTLGAVGCFSFDYVKVMTTGEGGMVVTDDPETYRQADCFHDHGHPHLAGVPRGREPRMRKGFNYRMNEIQGALGLAQLRKLDSIVARQRENKKAIKEAIQNLPGLTMRTLHDPTGEIATFLMFFAESPARAERIKEKMAASGVAPATLNYWHFEALTADCGGEYPQTAGLLARSVGIEIQTLMDEGRRAVVAEAIASAVAA